MSRRENGAVAAPPASHPARCRKLTALCPKHICPTRPAQAFTSQLWRCSKWELNMNDLIVYAGVGILLVGLPVLIARFTTKH